ncbi:uncharacterized protein LOC143899985 [Temnothorax americanus]|uniref:uncharacterized protein LOC143899985 n=1 Tax=Temnothorax americanus TaxID=1964332 RepID=UPI0040694780
MAAVTTRQGQAGPAGQVAYAQPARDDLNERAALSVDDARYYIRVTGAAGEQDGACVGLVSRWRRKAANVNHKSGVGQLNTSKLLSPRQSHYSHAETRAADISLHSSEPGKFTVAIFGRERRTGSKRRQKRVEEPGEVSQRSRGLPSSVDVCVLCDRGSRAA